MMKKNARFGIVALAVAGLAALSLYAYNANRAPGGASPGPAEVAAGGVAKPPGGFPTAVEVARVSSNDFADDVLAVGTLKSNESVVLRPETAGRIAAIGFKDGAVIARGTELVRLDAAIQQAELQQAAASLALARSSHQRNVELLGRKFLSQQAVDNSAATLKVQEAAVQLAQAKLARMQIVAPFRGMVGLRNVSVGDYVKEGQELINIEDIASLRVDFKLPENYLGRVHQGQVVEVMTDALPGERFKAVLDAIDPLVDPNSRAIASRARLDNAAGKLRPGMFVRVRLLFGERQKVLMVPEQAIVSGSQPAVFKVVDGKVALLRIKLGVRRAAQVEVVEGLDEGDIVVTAGQLKLRDGAPVQAIGDGSAAAKVSTPATATAAATGVAAGK